MGDPHYADVNVNDCKWATPALPPCHRLVQPFLSYSRNLIAPSPPLLPLFRTQSLTASFDLQFHVPFPPDIIWATHITLFVLCLFCLWITTSISRVYERSTDARRLFYSDHIYQPTYLLGLSPIPFPI